MPELPKPEPIDFEHHTDSTRRAVLIIEPVDEIALYLRGLFTGAGFNPSIESDGESGLGRMGSETFDLVISEYLLPGMLGDEVFRRIRADAPSRTVPILMLTQMAEPAKLQEAITAGANDYVLKPFDPIELTARARAAIRRSQN